MKDRTQSGAAAEIKIIPAWAWVLAGVVLLCMPFLFSAVLAHRPDAPAAWVRPLLGLLLGLVAGCFLLFLGYINRDAKRRGMSPVLWTIVAILVPNGLGIILYFVLRQPLRSTCPQCGNVVQAGFSFCPRCSHKLGASCPRCQRVVGLSDAYCPYCGASLPSQAASGPPTGPPG